MKRLANMEVKKISLDTGKRGKEAEEEVLPGQQRQQRVGSGAAG
jgi:hypothetical protein